MKGSLIDQVGRRTFLKVLGAATPAAAVGACSPVPPERIIPYVVPAEDHVPGVATWYATTCRECPAGCGTLVRTREGRAVKIEGNPAHPVNQGRLCIRGQAALQGLYNPDRVRGPRVREVMNAAAGQSRLAAVEWDAALALLAGRLRSARAGAVAVLTPLLTGALDRLVDQWAAAVGARRLRYEPFAHESLRAAGRLCFGRHVVPTFDLSAARTLVSFGADYLETWLSPVEHAAAFAQARRVADPIGDGPPDRLRVVHVEPRFSLTAASADLWIAAEPGTEVLVALAMTHVIVTEGRAQIADADAMRVAALVAAHAPERVSGRTGVPPARIVELARAFSDPVVGPGRSLAMAGGAAVSGSSATALHAATYLLNFVAGNLGRTVRFGPEAATDRRPDAYADVRALMDAMRAGEIDVLVTCDVNPRFTLPDQAGVAEALARVGFIVSLSNVLDETAAAADLVLPTHGPLEAWGDHEPRAGIRGLMQPVMAPLFDSRHAGDLFLDLARRLGGGAAAAFETADFHAYLRADWRALFEAAGARGEDLLDGTPDNFDLFWDLAVQRGGLWQEAPPVEVALSREVEGLAFEPAALTGADDGLVVLPYASPSFYDGRGADRAWLQEIPDPVTKAAWSGWAEVHPDTARALGAQDGQVVRVETVHGVLDVPVLVNPHLHAAVIAMPIGQGHTALGRYAAGRGANPIALVDPAPEPVSGAVRWLSARARVTALDLFRPVPRLQATEAQFDRGIARAATMDDLRAGRIPPEAEHRSLYPDHAHADHRWGLVVDLDVCTGCSACVAACYAENNVPVLGEAEARRGRTMAWLRIERFVEPRGEAPGGTPSDAEARHVPMLCQHCDHAPCETVCPVYATYHTADGLNAQVYNRCVGTRYCSNNCPYTARRFNWFEPAFPDPLPLQLNPDVTVRGVGVMEKCTFCVQRIAEGRDRAKDDGRAVRDGDIVPACAQTCPTQAIVFGDLADPASRASRLAGSPRGYHVFGELNTRPAVTYLRKIT